MRSTRTVLDDKVLGRVMYIHEKLDDLYTAHLIDHDDVALLCGIKHYIELQKHPVSVSDSAIEIDHRINGAFTLYRKLQ